MFSPKFLIASITGIATIGSAIGACTYYLINRTKDKPSEEKQVESNSPSPEERNSQTTVNGASTSSVSAMSSSGGDST